ncbi:MAG: RDD family protein [Coprobacillus sp.]|nr:RDD family protein [Coprobacillus sp.]
MSEDDLYNNYDPHIAMRPSDKIEIQYANPKFWKRVMAGVIDFIIFLVIFFLLFISCRGIVISTDTYKENNEELTSARVESGLYIDHADYGMIDIIAYLNRVDISGYARLREAQDAIDTFLSFCDDRCDEQTASMIRATYDEERLSDKFVDKYGNHYFIIDEDGEITINTTAYSIVTSAGYFDEFYTYYIDEVLQGYLVVAVPNYYDLTKYMSNVLIYAEILPAFLISGVLSFYLPTLIFRKGRKTFGQAIYHIGTIDKRLLNPSWKRSLARFLIFYFFILILSVFTFGIPIIISFSMMAFSRNKQGFPDFCLNLVQVSTQDNNIYDEYDQIRADLVTARKEPVNFSHRDLK